MVRGIKRTGAIVGSAALAATIALGLGAGTAQAQAAGTGAKSGLSFVRGLDKSTVKVGDVVEVTTTLKRDNANWWLVHWVKDMHPTCFDYVDGSATWTVSGKTYTQATKPNEVTVTDDAVQINPPAANSWEPPVVMKSRYTVNCGPGTFSSGGFEWVTTNGIDGHGVFREAGPKITVQKGTSSVSLGTIGSAQTGASKALNLFTSGVPDGETVGIYDGQTEIGQAIVTGGQATYQWTPSAAGAHSISARYAGNTKIAPSNSQAQTVQVTQSAEASSTTLDAISDAQVDKQTLLRASVAPAAAGSTVTFKVDNVVVGESPVVDGVATYGWTPSTTGTKTVVAEYSGGGNIASSVSEAQSVAVGEADPTITQTSTAVTAPATAKTDSAVTLSAQVTGGTEGTTVTFKSGATVIGQGTVDASGVATLEWKPTAPGRVLITAEYAGDTTTAASAGTAAIDIEEPTAPADPNDPGEPGGGSLPGGSLSGKNSAAGSLGSVGEMLGS